jgi:protein-disulfide isomerase
VLIVGALVVVLVAILAAVVFLGGGDSDSELVDQLEAAHAAFPTDMVDGTKVGSDDAPLKLVAFEDFQCPFCLMYTSEDEPTIIEEYVKAGKLQLEFRQLPLLGVESTNAATAAECAAEQNRFWDYHSLLFLTQARAGQVANEQLNVGRFSDDNLSGFAEEIGLDVAAFDKCYNSGDTLEAVQADVAEAGQRGIRGTPNFVLNGTTFGSDAGNIENWRTALDDLYTQITETPTTTASETPEATGSPSASETATAVATATPAP